MEKIGAAGTRWTLETEDGIDRGKQKSTCFPHNWNDMIPACTSITAPVVPRNGLQDDRHLKVLILV